MGRPQKNNCDYFPHFTTMRNHKKVKALRNKFGMVLGYAFWSMFLEYLTEQDGIELENSDLELEMFSGELGVSATEIRSMIDYCIKIELLFLNEDNFIYSESLNENLQPVFDKRQRAKESSKTRKRHKNGSYCMKKTNRVGVSATEMPQSRVEESKGKESKEKDAEIKSFILEYPLKEIKNLMINETSHLETLCLNNNLSKEKILLFLDNFFKKLENEGVEKKSVNDSKAHFARWLNIEKKKQEEQEVDNTIGKFSFLNEKRK
jgi:hypothetical protein